MLNCFLSAISHHPVPGALILQSFLLAGACAMSHNKGHNHFDGVVLNLELKFLQQVNEKCRTHQSEAPHFCDISHGRLVMGHAHE